MLQILGKNRSCRVQDERGQDFNMDVIFYHSKRVPHSKGTRRGWFEAYTYQW